MNDTPAPAAAPATPSDGTGLVARAEAIAEKLIEAGAADAAAVASHLTELEKLLQIGAFAPPAPEPAPAPDPAPAPAAAAPPAAPAAPAQPDPAPPQTPAA